ncbi:MAG: hypothetical protein HZA22_04490 [Nitrospirae bacterium]|nr:hypothetical protein [Nitrospirota bacterium]
MKDNDKTRRKVVKFNLRGKTDSSWRKTRNDTVSFIAFIVRKIFNANEDNPFILLLKETVKKGLDFLKAKTDDAHLKNAETVANITQKYAQAERDKKEAQFLEAQANKTIEETRKLKMENEQENIRIEIERQLKSMLGRTTNAIVTTDENGNVNVLIGGTTKVIPDALKETTSHDEFYYDSNSESIVGSHGGHTSETNCQTDDLAQSDIGGHEE